MMKPSAPFNSLSNNSPKRLMRPPSTPNLRTSFGTRPHSTSSSSSSQCSSPVRSISTRAASPTHGSRSLYQGTISVGVRIKPSKNKQDTWHVSNNSIIHEEFGEFGFDHVFGPSMSNNEVYETIALPMVDKLFEGFNCTIFAYGMTGSGKTYTMSGSDSGPGIIPMCVNTVFDRINEGLPNKKFNVKVSYLEIYNERIFDLLNLPQGKPFGIASNNMTNSANALVNDLKLRDDPRYGVKVVGLTERNVSSKEELMRCISIGDHNRKTGETDFNTRSSRSHAVVLIRVFCTDELTGEEVISTLSLCDLAGSERATGKQERRKEGAYINKSLLALGTVISKLSMESTGNGAALGHIPYRDSKLTRILQPALSGDSLVATICTIDTRPETNMESMNTIRFASRAKNITLNVKRNDSDSNLGKTQLIQSLRKQIREQQDLINSLTKQGNTRNDFIGTTSAQQTDDLLRKENEFLKLKLQHYENLELLEPTELRDSQLIEIIESLPSDIGVMLETKLMNMNSQFLEMKRYVAQVESLERRFTSSSNAPTELLSTAYGVDLTQVLHEQEQELMQLNQSLARKDKMIEALTSSKMLRHNLAEFSSNHVDNSEADKHTDIEKRALKPISSDASELNNRGSLERPLTIGSGASISHSSTTCDSTSSGNTLDDGTYTKLSTKYLTASDILPNSSESVR